jgi:hypothetical protein
MIKYYKGKRYEGTVEAIALLIFLDKRTEKKRKQKEKEIQEYHKPILDKLDTLIDVLKNKNDNC